MQINEMIKRENFFQILQDTIKDYFYQVRNQEIYFSYKPFNGSEKFRIYTLGSIVCREEKTLGTKQFLFSEWNIRKNYLKHLAGKGIICLLMNTRKVGSVKSFYISKGAIGLNEIISPQNRSIRFYDYDTGNVDCIIKSGFTNKYIKNHIEFRKKYSYNFIIPMIDSGDCWFRESILLGNPLARVVNESKYNKGIEDTINHISILAKDTLQYIPSKEYLDQLHFLASSLIENARLSKNIKSYDQCKLILSYIRKHVKTYSGLLPTCISHGDLQTGNIWMDLEGKTMIYDWETSKRRSIWYDCITLLYSLRRVDGWNNFWRATSLCDQAKNSFLFQNISTIPLHFIKTLILLEEILFLLEDMLELPETWGNNIFDSKISKIYSLLFKKSWNLASID